MGRGGPERVSATGAPVPNDPCHGQAPISSPQSPPWPCPGPWPSAQPQPPQPPAETTIIGATGGGGSTRDERQLREWFKLWQLWRRLQGREGKGRHQGENRWDPHGPNPDQARLSPEVLQEKSILVKRRGKEPQTNKGGLCLILRPQGQSPSVR